MWIADYADARNYFPVRSRSAARHVQEVNMGWFNDNGTGTGDSVDIDLQPDPEISGYVTGH